MKVRKVFLWMKKNRKFAFLFFLYIYPLLVHNVSTDKKRINLNYRQFCTGLYTLSTEKPMLIVDY